MAEIVDLAEQRRLRKAESGPIPELNEELGRIGAETLREMAPYSRPEPGRREEVGGDASARSGW